MSGFVSRAACRGHRPIHLIADQRYQRPELIARLLKERRVARFLVAPFGYGKTSLACEYASTVFNFVHTFWINGHSPCFIRDLDEGTISKSCYEVDPEIKLVVFEDIPTLDPDRADVFSQLLDRFLERNCEVIVTCTPACDMYGALQRDRVRLTAYDLLLSDDELDIVRMTDERERRPSYDLGNANRIPALVWRAESASTVSFISKSLKIEIPPGFGFAVACAFVLGSGSVQDLRHLHPFSDDALDLARRHYPHLGIEDEGRRFEAPTFTIEEVVAGLRKGFDSFIDASPFDSRKQLAFAWAEELLAAGNYGRACDVIRLVCPQRDRVGWVEAHAFDAVGNGCLNELLLLVEASRGATTPERALLNALESLCRRILGDAEGALKCAKRVPVDDPELGSTRICALLVLARRATGPDKARALKHLETAAFEPAGDNACKTFFGALARAAVAERGGVDAMIELWEELRATSAPAQALFVVASWLFGMVGQSAQANTEAGDGSFARVALSSAESFVREAIPLPDGRDFFVESAGLAMEQAHERGMPYVDGPLPTATLLWLRRSEMAMVMQRRAFEQREREELSKRENFAASHPDSLLVEKGSSALALPQRSVPVLSVVMFGKFEVQIGNTLISDKFARRKHLRALLVLLVANQGRELSSETIAAAMWPNRNYEYSRRNFYTVWSQLKRALKLTDGTCPYLIRHSLGCSLETRYVASDMERFNEICRTLLFNEPDYHQWPSIYAEIERDFASDLLPIEKNNVLVEKARDECRTRLVDALVSAATKTTATSNPEWGIWFARSALSHDDTREDAHYALMRAQLDAGQRTAAMASFIECRDILAEKLGVDPSPETMALYETMLNGGTELRDIRL